MPYVALDPASAAAAPVTTIGQPLTDEGETLASFRAELKALAIRTDVDTRLDGWINLAYRHVAAMVTLSEMMGSLAISTVADQPLYLLPRAVAWIKAVPLSDPTLFSLAGGRNMTMTDLPGYRELPDYPPGWNFWGPYRYFRFGRILALWPKPAIAQSVIIDFRVRPLDMTDDHHSPILPPEWHEGILMRARHVAFRSLQMFDKAAIAQNDFLSSIRTIENTDASEVAGKTAGFYPAQALRSSYRRAGSTRYRDEGHY